MFGQKKLLTLFVFLQFQTILYSETTYKFDHLSLEQGISHNLTNCIIQDSKGFMWFATLFGLIKYDGTRYTVYRNVLSDPTTVSHDDILTIYEDHLGFLWIGTRGGGLNRFNRATEQFIRFMNDPGYSNSLSNNIVNAICQDKEKNLWIGTHNGLNRLSSQDLLSLTNQDQADTVKFSQFNNDLWDVTSVSDNIVTSLYADTDSSLWIGTQNGLNLFEPDLEIFTRYFHYHPDYTYAYNDQVNKFVDNLMKSDQKLAALSSCGHFADRDSVFKLSSSTFVLIYTLGEGRSEFRGDPIEDMSDFGWLEDNNSGQIIWQMNFVNSLYAGGAEKNRVKAVLLSLKPGSYRLRYQSDDSHAFPDWNNFPPDRPEDWGISAFKLDASQARFIAEHLKNTVPLKLNSISDNRITTIAGCEDENYLWIGTGGGGLNKFNKSKNEFNHYMHQPGYASSLSSNYIHSIFSDKSCALWIGTDKGVCKFLPDEESSMCFKHDPLNPQTISSNNVVTIYGDLSGTIWFGTYWGGIDKLDNRPSNFRHIRKQLVDASGVADNNIFSINSNSPQMLLIGSAGDGLMLYDRKKHKFLKPKIVPKSAQNIADEFIPVIYKDSEGIYWIGTYGAGLFTANLQGQTLQIKNIYRYDNRNPLSLSSNFINTIFQDHRGLMWVGTNAGLNMLNKEKSTFLRFSHNPAEPSSLRSDQINTIYEDRNQRLWVGTSSGLALMDMQNKGFIHFYNQEDNPTSLINNFINVIFQSENIADSTLWIGTSGGLSQYIPSRRQFISFTEENGLPNRVISGILEDISGHLWISTNRGISKLDPRNRIFKNYDVFNGLQSNMFNIRSMHRLTTGELAFGGINGFNIFHPKAIVSNAFNPPIYITGFKIFDQNRKFDRAITELDEITLSHTDNFFAFEFAALDYVQPQKIEYAYRLKGVDKRWIHSGNTNSASYTNVSPGSYRFEVRATNSDGIWGENYSHLQINILPPFWMTLWFRLLMALIFILFVLGIVYLIIQKEKRKTELNKKIAELKLQALRAQMNPHFIFNTLNSIQYFITNHDSKAAYNYLEKFSKLMRRTLDNSDRSSIPLSEEVESLKTYLELQLLRFENKFKYTIKIDPQIDIFNIEIPPMIIQPYIENAIHHGLMQVTQKGEILVHLGLIGNKLICTIEDNGIGIKKSLELKKLKQSEHRSSGMNITRERLQIINAKYKNNINVTIQDLKEKSARKSGTRVVIHIPVFN